MGMFELRVTPDGGETIDISAGMRDVRMWEKTHKGRSMGMLRDADGVSAGLLFEIAYASMRRQGLLPDGLTEEEFTETYELDIEDENEKAARLRAEALTARIEGADAEEVPDEADPTPAGASPVL
jgi:hypothetical protein